MMSLCAPPGGDSGDSFRLFQEDLKDDDHELVMATTARLSAVATLIGPARTRAELIPFLLEYVEQDSDEAHTSISRQLGDFSEVRRATTTAALNEPALPAGEIFAHAQMPSLQLSPCTLSQHAVTRQQPWRRHRMACWAHECGCTACKACASLPPPA